MIRTRKKEREVARANINVKLEFQQSAEARSVLREICRNEKKKS